MARALLACRVNTRLDNWPLCANVFYPGHAVTKKFPSSVFNALASKFRGHRTPALENQGA
jgi:hypothetical protein